MKEVITIQEYESALNLLLDKIYPDNFDCIVCLKRSGFIIGTFLSNKLDKPLFTASEIKSIPDKFKKVLIVDDKICTGKSIRKIVKRLPDKISETACLFIEANTYTNYYVSDVGKVIKMWYEV